MAESSGAATPRRLVLSRLVDRHTAQVPGRALSETLADLLAEIRTQPGLGSIIRVAVILHDPLTDDLTTFVDSMADRTPPPLDHYAVRLADVPSLAEVRLSRRLRIIDDMAALAGSAAPHTARVIGTGARSSLTVPLFQGDTFLGFLFLNADRPGAFDPDTVARLEPLAEIAALAVINDVALLQTVRATAAAVRGASHGGDDETDAHLARISRLAGMVARALAGRVGWSDAAVHQLVELAPLHDIGKVAVPPEVLAHPGRLDDTAMAQARQHVAAGIRLVAQMVPALGGPGTPAGRMLHEVVATHHENLDGSGYPAGFAGAAIPLAGRIMRVVDTFDATTSPRVWRTPWSQNDAFAYLDEYAGRWFDPDVVEALRAAPAAVTAIRSAFPDP